jgi:hypothetical protein
MDKKKALNIFFCFAAVLSIKSNTLRAQSQDISYLLSRSVGVELSQFGYDTTNISKIRDIAYDTVGNFIVCDEALIFLAQHGDQSVVPMAAYRFYKYLSLHNYIGAYDVCSALSVLTGNQGFHYVVELTDSIISDRNAARNGNQLLLPDIIATLMDFNDYSWFALYKGLFTGKERVLASGLSYYYDFYIHDPIKFKEAYDSVKSILLYDKDSKYRFWACRTLGRMGGSNDEMTTLKQVSGNDSSAEVRYWAAVELKLGGDTISAINAYGTLLKSPIEMEYRELAAGDLYDLGTPEAFSMLYQTSKGLSNEAMINYTKSYLEPCFPYIDSTVQLKLSFLETVVQRCGALNWITNQQLIDQLDELIKETQTSFAANDTIHFVLKLEQVVSLLYIDSSYISEVGRKFLYYDARNILYDFPSICVIKLINSSGSPLLNGSLQYYEGSSWKDAPNNNNGNFIVNTLVRKKVNLRMTFEYGTQTKLNVPIGSDTIIFQTKSFAVNLQNSQGTPLDTGIVQYNSTSGPVGASWQNFGTTSNGVVTNELLPIKYTFRLTYNGATVSKAQNIDSNATVIFQTIPTSVQLQTSIGAPLDTGVVQYNATGWQNYGITLNGVVSKELLPTKYSFRMTYNGATVTKSQSLDSNATVVFQTVPANVQLQTSSSAPLDTGIVQFNAAGWKNFGTTANGVVTKELLPTKYTFRMTYNGATVSKSQSIDSNLTVVFHTIPAIVQLQTSTGIPLDTGIVQYNASGWKSFGTTTNGIATKELLPTNYNFRMTYDGATVSQAQSIDSNATVIFQTVKTLVQFNNSKGNPIDTGIVQFNSGGPVGAGWQSYGNTSHGVVSKELLPVKYTFRLTYCGSTVSIAQNVDSNATVVFSTVLCTVSVTNSSGSLLNNATVSYNAGGPTGASWNIIGTTTNGIVTKEFLPAKIQFRAAYGSKQQSVTQDVSVNPIISITLPVQ